MVTLKIRALHQERRSRRPSTSPASPPAPTPLSSPTIEINPEFRRALDIMETTGRHIFITGKAGTGKSTLLDYFRNATRKKVAVLAPTGVAALNVRGQTIHSFCRFKPGPGDRLSQNRRHQDAPPHPARVGRADGAHGKTVRGGAGALLQEGRGTQLPYRPDAQSQAGGIEAGFHSSGVRIFPVPVVFILYEGRAAAAVAK